MGEDLAIAPVRVQSRPHQRAYRRWMGASPLILSVPFGPPLLRIRGRLA